MSPIKPIFPIGHFYSPIVDKNEIGELGETFWQARELPGIDMNDNSHRDVLTRILPNWMSHFDYPIDEASTKPGQFYLANDQFTWLDARILFAFLAEWKPRRVIEVGSGYSTAIMLDVKRRFLNDRLAITCIEPYPRPFLVGALRSGNAELLQTKVQQLPTSTFDTLGAGDVLFIDSSHICKSGSDCNYLLLEVLPRLKPGVRVHIHDIFLPFEYPKAWVIDQNRSWNEQYLVRALLTYSSAFRVLFGSSYTAHTFAELASTAITPQPAYGVGGGSLWIERTSG